MGAFDVLTFFCLFFSTISQVSHGYGIREAYLCRLDGYRLDAFDTVIAGVECFIHLKLVRYCHAFFYIFWKDAL